MANDYFRFKQFTIQQQHCAMKVTTDGCLFGAWVAAELSSRQPLRLLDVGTGTGLLALMAAQQQHGHTEAIETDPAACRQAQENIAASPWAAKLTVAEADVRQYCPQHKYDVIFSNPPFYETDLAGPDSRRNMAHHSSNLTVKELLLFIIKNLSVSGSFFLLLPFRRLQEVQTMLNTMDLHVRQQVLVRSSDNHAYFRVMLEGGFEHAVCTTQTLSIYNAERQYTPAFVQLLQPYYLAL
jgi:tRNA1Val (adenine37-N6)-methyltransferase